MKGRLSALTGIAIALMATGAVASEGGLPNPAADWDVLWNKVLWDLVVIGAIFGIAALIMLFKYRATSPDQVGRGPKLSRAQALAWALIPATIFMADDFFMAAKGWTLWNTYRTVPENAMEVKVTGSMWNWEFEYENGIISTYDVDSKEGSGLVVPVGTPVVLRMESIDVIHSFGMATYRVKEDVMPGRITYIWFNPVEAKESWVTCVEFCGTRHSYMYAPVKAVPPAQYEAWVKKMESEA
ncbi:MAG: hypothetical protein HQL54_01010 [Magnetococcales bacterium]|nr:hypothetical protein [Magnetococcales bacterium]